MKVLAVLLLVVVFSAEARIKGGGHGERLLKQDKSNSNDSKDSNGLLVCPNNPGSSFNYPDGFCEICSKDNKSNNGRPDSLTLEYVGMNSQNSLYQDADHASCRQNFYPSSTEIFVHGTTYSVDTGTVFVVPGPFNAETVFNIANFGGCFIHTSCSQPLVAGDVIGPFRIIAGNSCDVNNPPTSPPFSDACCVVCDGDNKNRPSSLTFIYRSEGKNPVYQDRSDCAAGMYPVDAVVTMNGQTFLVGDGDVFTVNGEFEANSDVTIARAGFTTVSCTIHTSCSQPLVAGDQFGPLLLIEGNSCESSAQPSLSPSVSPSDIPTTVPSSAPSKTPSSMPSSVPSPMPSSMPSASPSIARSDVPSLVPTAGPTLAHSDVPSLVPSASPTFVHSDVPSLKPSSSPTFAHSDVPSLVPTDAPSSDPSAAPSDKPSSSPSVTPSAAPSFSPSFTPSVTPSAAPSATPSVGPSSSPSSTPSVTPSAAPSIAPSVTPSTAPSVVPSSAPTSIPSSLPSVTPCLRIVETDTIPCNGSITVVFDWAGVPQDTLFTLLFPNASTIDEIGIYPCDEDFRFPRFAEAWQRTCSLGCDRCSEPRYSGTMVFDRLPVCNQFSSIFRWPPGPSGDICVKALLYREGISSPPYVPICQSQEIIMTDCP